MSSLFEEALLNLESKNLEKETTKCTHENIIEDKGVNLCTICGMEIEKKVSYEKDWRFYGRFDTKNASDPTRVHIRKDTEKNIYKDIQKMNFTHEIVEIANSIYLQITKGKIKRGKSRKSIIFACVLEAFYRTEKEDNKQIPTQLIKVFNITRKDGLHGRKFLELNLPKKELKNNTVTPVHIIKDILQGFNAKKEQISEVVGLYHKTKDRHTLLNRARPQSVAAGITFYWFKKNKIKITIKEFSKKVNLSELTINNICDIIDEILSS